MPDQTEADIPGAVDAADVPGDVPADVRADIPAADPLTDRIARDMRAGLRVAGLFILTAVHLGLALPALLASLRDYDQPWVQLSAFTLLTLLIMADALLGADGRGRPRPWVVLGLTCALVASAVSTSRLPVADFLGTPHWTFLEIGWFGVLLLFDAGLRPTLVFIGGHLVLTLAQLLLAGVPTRQAASGMAVSALAICTFQVAAAMLARSLGDCAAAASATAREQERVRTEAAVAAQVHADQRARYAELDRSVMPLLTGLADGSLDPGDEGARRRSAVEAARLRRLFAERDHAHDPLLHELRAGMDVAERHGVDVQLAVRGACAPVDRRLRRALTEPVLAALATAERDARATVVRGGGLVRVSVVTDCPATAPTEIPEPTEPGVRVRTVRSEGRLLVEASCTLDGPADAPADAPEDALTASSSASGSVPVPVPVSAPADRGHSSSSDVSPS
ncbi:hypothetical protein AB0P17_16005 [Streptomyces sp. NPDC088124]|uniref:hypothetical protein n=1 Tax=Streptomyces sp. NPDC088124 TaxID=3154654 RepID=UPI003414FD1F